MAEYRVEKALKIRKKIIKWKIDEIVKEFLIGTNNKKTRRIRVSDRNNKKTRRIRVSDRNSKKMRRMKR